MPSASSRWCRAFAAVATLIGVLCALLLCADAGRAGTGATGATGGGTAADARTAGDGTAGVSAAPAMTGVPVPAAMIGVSAASAMIGVSAAPVVTGVRMPAAMSAPGAGHQAPGCDDGSRDDGGLGPATPPRGSSPYQLLPALQSAHSASGCSAVDDTVLDVAPERGPPPVAAPSPMDLSVLRV
ncbi:hypothetical protein ACFU5O_31055 [Streptomyces sp. NPDC057445]|uniref:hypothetical protein n=1 Tax=Streptomyces sp. NPDC057445 TaxID=3346136 RepID=UPI0036A30CCA